MPDESKFRELLAVLVKLESSKRHCNVEIHFDGKRFHWSVKFGGLRASEFNLAQQFPPRNTSEETGH
jgi:hypothetical protein